MVLAPREEPSVELRGPELTTTAGSLGDPFRTIESLPGVATVAWPAPIYAIRGSNPGNTGYFLDDLQVPLLFHLLLGPAVIHPALFDGMTFYPGGYPARYGRYVAGIVAARTRAAAEDRLRATAEVRLYDTGALVSVPFPDGNGGAAAAFRYSYTGLLLSLLRSDLHLSYWDYQLRADRRWRGFRLTPARLRVERRPRLPSAELSRRREPQPGRCGQHGLPEPALPAALPSRQRAGRQERRRRPTVGGAGLRRRRQHGAARPRSCPSACRRTASCLGSPTSAAGAWVDVEAGADAQVQWFRPQTTVVEAGGSDIARERTAVLVGAYLSATVRAHDRLTLTPGLRFDSYTISGVTRVDLGPRLSARFALDSETWLTASGGRFSQPPSLAVQIPAAESFGLALYGLQTSWQAAVGIGTRHVRGFEAEVTGYVQRYVLSDLRDPALLDPDPLAADFLVRRDARSYGVEVMIRRPPTERLHGWLSYTLSQSERALGAGVIGPSDWDQRHILNLVMGYRLGRTTLGARGHYHSGQPVLVQGTRAQAFVRLPAFYQLDLRIERRVLFDAFTLDLYAEVVNTTMTRMVYGLRQDPATGERHEYSLRLLPALGRHPGRALVDERDEPAHAVLVLRIPGQLFA